MSKMSQRYWLDIYSKETGNICMSHQIFGNNDYFEELQEFAGKYTDVDEDDNFDFKLTGYRVGELLETVDYCCEVWLDKREELTGEDVVINVSQDNKMYKCLDYLYQRLSDLDELKYYFTVSALLLRFLKESDVFDVEYDHDKCKLVFEINDGYEVRFTRS